MGDKIDLVYGVPRDKVNSYLQIVKERQAKRQRRFNKTKMSSVEFNEEIEVQEVHINGKQRDYNVGITRNALCFFKKNNNRAPVHDLKLPISGPGTPPKRKSDNPQSLEIIVNDDNGQEIRIGFGNDSAKCDGFFKKLLRLTEGGESISDDSFNCGELSGPGSPEELKNGFQEMFSSPIVTFKFKDIKLTDVKLYAHQSILAARSSYYKNRFDETMKKGMPNEEEISDFERDTVEEMLRFLYFGETAKLNELACELLIFADKYAIKDLEIVCEKIFPSQIRIENAAQLLSLANIHMSQKLKEAVTNFIILNIKEIVETHGWKLLKESNPNLSTEVLLTGTIRASRCMSSFPHIKRLKQNE